MQSVNALRFPVLAPILALALWSGMALSTCYEPAPAQPEPVLGAWTPAVPDAGAKITEAEPVAIAQAGLLCLTRTIGAPQACVEEVLRLLCLANTPDSTCTDEALRVAELPQILEDDLGDEVP